MTEPHPLNKLVIEGTDLLLKTSAKFIEDKQMESSEDLLKLSITIATAYSAHILAGIIRCSDSDKLKLFAHFCNSVELMMEEGLKEENPK